MTSKRQDRYESNIASVVEWYKRNETIYAISCHFGINAITVRTWLKRAGVFEVGRGKISDEIKAAVLRMYAAGDPIKSITSATGVINSTIIRIAAAAGMARSQSESQAVRAARDAVGFDRFGAKGAFHSKKMGAWIPTDSRYEFARLLQLEDRDDVVAFYRCADRIPYVHDGSERIYVPDLEIRLADGSVEIEEIKPEKFLGRGANPAKFDAARRFYAAQGKKYTVVVERDIGRRAIDLIDTSSLSITPVEEVRKKRLAAAHCYLSRRSPERKAADNLKAKIREKARRDAMSPEQRAAYNLAAKQRRADKKARISASE